MVAALSISPLAPHCPVWLLSPASTPMPQTIYTGLTLGTSCQHHPSHPPTSSCPAPLHVGPPEYALLIATGLSLPIKTMSFLGSHPTRASGNSSRNILKPLAQRLCDLHAALSSLYPAVQALPMPLPSLPLRPPWPPSSALEPPRVTCTAQGVRAGTVASPNTLFPSMRTCVPTEAADASSH